MIFADYDYYVSTYYGTLVTSETEYIALATKAAVDINYYTLGAAEKNADLTAVKLCSCAVVDQYKIITQAQARSAGDDLQSESVGSYTRSFRSPAEASASAQAEIKSLIQRHLAATGLLYRGVSTCLHRTQ